MLSYARVARDGRAVVSFLSTCLQCLRWIALNLKQAGLGGEET
jgi:hypothetical protein